MSSDASANPVGATSADPAAPAGNTRAAAQNLPFVETDLAAPAILARLDTAARRGRLPGYRPGTAPTSFCVAAFGTPYDGVLHAVVEAGSPTRVRFRASMVRKGPAIFLATSVLAAWPGVWLTDSMLRLYFSWYHYNTYLWYLPLTLVPLPWMWRRSMRRSWAEIGVSAGGQIASIAKELGGRIVDSAGQAGVN